MSAPCTSTSSEEILYGDFPKRPTPRILSDHELVVLSWHELNGAAGETNYSLYQQVRRFFQLEDENEKESSVESLLPYLTLTLLESLAAEPIITPEVGTVNIVPWDYYDACYHCRKMLEHNQLFISAEKAHYCLSCRLPHGISRHIATTEAARVWLQKRYQINPRVGPEIGKSFLKIPEALKQGNLIIR